ncbi:PAS domain S-box protein [Flavobacterium cellulosilyticum]|uniref:histidine kinase n=1 Tax=Flavobacterium cellulosilyticum TaxID=2541731 RepID=A0A4R5CKK1_9FLAO|nr:PAS domain S-box protein [Flavobacterium cellulosilyticum]TDD97964.1 PAS domain S-box protein [Flavobacterium cellulosilyticum]
MKNIAKSTPASILRQKAEEIINNKTETAVNSLSDVEILKLIHELDVHQVELEMQNEELLFAKNKAEAEAEKYTNLYDFAPSGYFTLSKEGKIIELNFKTAELLGKERSLLLKRQFNAFISDETRPKFNLFLEQLFDSKTKQNCEVILNNASNNPTYVHVSGIISDDEMHCFITMHDISQLKESEEKTKLNEEKYRTLFDSNRDSIAIFRLDNNNKPGKFLITNTAASSLFGFSQKELLSISVKEIEKMSDKKRMELLQTLQNNGNVDFETIIKNKHGNYRNVEVKSMIINYLEEPAVMNITRDITDRKLTEENISNAQENLMAILDAVPDLLFEVGLDGRIYHYQSHHDDLLAVPPSVFMGNFFQDVLPADVAKICFKAIEEANKKGWSTGLQYSFDLPKGKLWFELSVSPIKGKVKKDKHFILLARNITERKLGEEKLRDEKERIKTIFELVGNPIFLKDNNYNIIYANTAFFELFGLDEKNVIGKTLVEKVPKNEREHFLQIDRTVLETGVPDIREEELTVKGFKHTIITKKLRYINELGNKFLVCSIYDITKRKEVEEKLKLASEKFQDLVNSTGGIVWEADATSLVFNYVSQEAERLLGYPVEDWYKKGFWEDHLHPDDREEIIKIYNSHTKLKNGHDFKYRFRAKAGNYVWLKDIVTVVAENGKPSWLRGVMFDITEQKETNQALLESEEKYRGLVEGSPNGIVLYSDEKIIYINDEGLRILKAKKRSDIIGKPVLNFIHPDRKKSVIQRMNEVIEHKYGSVLVEEKLIDLKGNPIDVELKAIPTIFEHKAAVQVIIHDITERKQTQEKIRQLSQAVEQSPVTIVITNTNGEIEYTNPKFTETSGYTFEEVLGKNTRILKSGHTTQEEYKELWQTLVDGKEWHGEFLNMKKNGELYWESVSISPIVNAQGESTHYIAIKEDITARKNTEQELLKAKNQAEESDRLKLAFLANMSHEIRTPMNGILGFTELLKEPKLTGKEQQEYITIIEKSGKRMLNIINDIINISKVESGQIEVSLSETNVNEQIDYLNTFFKPETKKKGIQLLVTKKLSSEECYVITDREKLYAVLTNLIKNAIKFTNEGSIEFGCVKKENKLEFFIKDTGLGISITQQNIIFERFRQVNESTTRSHEGSGLGLAISKAYIEMIGGTIWVESEEGKGSTFYFTIPYDTEFIPKKINHFKNEDAVIKEKNNITDLKVLIVEDDAISKLLITIALKPFSKEIIKVDTGFEAIEKCRNNPDIDLVMMDINMPEMGGYEATKQIREFNKDIVIIIQTANGMQSDRDNAIAAGCTDYISKPINIEYLSTLIQKHLKK